VDISLAREEQWAKDRAPDRALYSRCRQIATAGVTSRGWDGECYHGYGNNSPNMLYQYGGSGGFSTVEGQTN
jgi:hypothetical protein